MSLCPLQAKRLSEASHSHSPSPCSEHPANAITVTDLVKLPGEERRGCRKHQRYPPPHRGIFVRRKGLRPNQSSEVPPHP